MSTRIGQVTDAELNVLWRVANGIAKGRRFKDVSTPEDAFARILVGRDLGMTPTDAVGSITFNDGSAVIAADVQAALLRNFVGPDGERYDYDVVTPAEVRDAECHIEIKRREPGRKTWKSRGVEVFSLEDAERAELTGNEYWRKWPRRMLFARALTAAIAMYAPETVHPQLDTQLRASEILDLTAERPAVGETGELDDNDPLKAQDVIDRVENPGPIKQGQVQMAREMHDYLEQRGELQRFVDLLDVVGAPEADDLVTRVMKLDENQAAEFIVRMDIAPRALSGFARDRRRQNERQHRGRHDAKSDAALAEQEAATA